MNIEEPAMNTREQKASEPVGSEKEKEAAKERTGAGTGDACRCKETSEMTPRQLVGLMISDLAFWKKTKKD